MDSQPAQPWQAMFDYLEELGIIEKGVSQMYNEFIVSKTEFTAFTEILTKLAILHSRMVDEIRKQMYIAEAGGQQVADLSAQLREITGPSATIDIVVPVYNGEHALGRPDRLKSRVDIPKCKEEETPARDDRPDTSNNEFAITPTPINPRQTGKKLLPAAPLKLASPPVSPSRTASVYAGGSHSADWTSSDNDLVLKKKILVCASDKYTEASLRLPRDKLMQILRSLDGKMVSR